VEQAFSQEPQCAASLCTSTHSTPQNACPAGQAQAPCTHDCPPRHGLPQVPQFAPFVRGSIQVPPHSMNPAGHAQVPATHEVPWAQAIPHAPQWSAFVRVSTHSPLHEARPGAHGLPAPPFEPPPTPPTLDMGRAPEPPFELAAPATPPEPTVLVP